MTAIKNTWQNRIIRTGEKPAREFNFHPDNWKGHPQTQRDALNAILSQIGWVQGVIVNRQTGNLIDGHARVEEALEQGARTIVPFVEVDLSPDEERLILALYDPLGGMAQTNAESFLNLTETLDIDSAALLDVLANISDEFTIPKFKEFDESVESEVEMIECPKCSHTFPK